MNKLIFIAVLAFCAVVVAESRLLDDRREDVNVNINIDDDRSYRRHDDDDDDDRKKRAIILDPVLQQQVLLNPTILDPVLLRGKRDLISDIANFGQDLTQSFEEQSDLALREKRALLVADSYLEALLLNKPVMSETLVMQPTMLRGKRDTFEQDTIATDAFGNRVEVDNLVRNKRATIIQDVFLTRDLFGNLVEQPVLLIV